MMKQALVVLALVGFAFSAPQPRKLFHEHVEEFLAIIMENSGHEMEHLMEHHIEFDEFQALEYLRTNNFKDLVVEFLENDNIDIHYFIDWINNLIENIERKSIERRSTSGKDLASFVRDCIATFPKDKLQALFAQKISEDEEFKIAVENLKREEWDAVFGALWESEVFKAEVQPLADNGIEIGVFLEQVIAIFGQN